MAELKGSLNDKQDNKFFILTMNNKINVTELIRV